MNTTELFYKDLSTFSKRDLITLAKYYNIPITLDYVKQLAKKQANLYKKGEMTSEQDELIKAIKNNDQQRVEEIIESGIDIDSTDDFTPLILAVKNNNSDIVELLIFAGANIDEHDTIGYTALMFAVDYGIPEIVKLLIDAGANLDVQNKHKETALIYALQYNNYDIIKLLIDAGANPNIKDTIGYTLLINAVQFDNPEIVKLLIDAGASLNEKDENGNTPLIIAVKSSNLQITQILIDAGANPNIKDKSGKTAIDYATNYNILQLLQNYKMDLGYKTTQKYTGGNVYNYIPDNISEEDLKNFDNEKLIELAKKLEINYENKNNIELAHEIWSKLVENNFGKAQPDKLLKLRDTLCKDLNDDFNVQELQGMAKALKLKYKDRVKSDLCTEIATKLVIDKKLTQLPLGDYKGGVPKTIGEENNIHVKTIEKFLNTIPKMDGGYDEQKIVINMYKYLINNFNWVKTYKSLLNQINNKAIEVYETHILIPELRIVLVNWLKLNNIFHIQLAKYSQDGNLRMVNKLIEDGANVNIKNHKGNTALKIARLNNRQDIVNALINAGAKQ